MFRTISKIVDQWIALFALIFSFAAAVLVAEWVMRYWIAILAVLATPFVIIFIIGCVNDLIVLKKVRDIKKSIANTPKLTRYAWSSVKSELIEQWKLYKAEGKTPMRRSTIARKKRKEMA
jgi:uncharacterized membrane protein